MAKIAPKSDAKRRELQCYPPEKYLTLVKGYAELNGLSRSKAGVDIIRCFFNQLPKEELKRYQNAATNKNRY